MDRCIPPDKPIGVLVSGGMDSAVLWYAAKMICMHRKQECLPYTIAKLDGAEYHAGVVIDKTCELLGIPPVTTTMVGTRSDDPSETTISGLRDVIRVHGKYALNGDTAYFDDLDHGPVAPRVRGDRPDKFIQPFFDFTKEKTILFAEALGILDELIPITHSCTLQDEGKCGICYWCKERDAAFKMINIADYGHA